MVSIYYFTKWIAAEPFSKITEQNTRNFIWKNIVCQFGIPKVIVSNNENQFDNDGFKLFCSDLAIANHFSSPGHNQKNNQVVVANRTILRNLKTRLKKSKGGWTYDLPSMLWAYHTMSRIPMGETPYSLVYGTKAIIPVEIGMPTFHMENFNKEANR